MKSLRYGLFVVLLALSMFLAPAPAAAQATQSGALIAAACPCNGPITGGDWMNHGQYVACVTGAAKELRDTGVIAENERGRLVREAAQSECGIKKAAEEEEEREASLGVLAMQGASESTFNPLQVTLTFALQNARFAADPVDYSAEVNGQEVALSDLTVAPTAVSFDLTLRNGRNDLVFYGKDDAGYLVEASYTLWAGNRSLPVTVIDESGLPVDGAVVRVVLSDDEAVAAEAVTLAGGVTFPNVPLRTLLVSALTPDNRFVSVATIGDGTPLQLQLLPFEEPSPIANNDFSLGLDGWNVAGAPVQLIPHVEPTASKLHGPNMDLQLNTAGEGPQSISRTFTIQPGTKNVTVRYRFITSEVPGGYFGSVWNDNFSVSIRSQQGGGYRGEQNSMNGLGLAAFDGAGATAWREVALPVSEEGDVVQVDVSVANVGDGLYDSQVVVDLVDEKQLAVTAVALRDIDNGALTYLSLGPHPYFGGNTRVHGTITVEGAKDDQLSALVLEVLRGGSVIATGTLSAAAQSALFVPFGSDERVEVSASQLLFETPGGAAPVADGNVSLRVRARSAAGEEATREAGSAGILTRYEGGNRYGQRDGGQGGDDWARPSVRALLGNLAGLTIGDISNMNGGPFPPHGSHRDGNDVDAWFPGYNNRDAATAQTILDLLNGANGSRIDRVLVTFSQTPGNAFYDAIRNVTLNDGRAATAVIRPYAGHTTHLHLRINAGGGAGGQAQQFAAGKSGRTFRGYPGRVTLPADEGETAGDAQGMEAATAFGLAQNYPNPFNPTTEIRFTLPEAAAVRLVIYDATGREMLRLVDGTLAAGTHTATWNADAFPSGLYLYRLEAGGQHTTRSMLLIK